MQLKTALLFATPCDDEEDNMATLCCHSDKGQMFLLTRYPDEDTVDLTLDDEPSTLDGLKVTLSAQRLLIEVAPGIAMRSKEMSRWKSSSRLPAATWRKWR